MVADSTWGIIVVVGAIAVATWKAPSLAKALPEMGRNLGRAVGSFRKGRQEIEAEMATLAGPSPPPGSR